MSGVFFMFGLEVNDTVVVEQRKVLEDALSTNPKTQKALQKLIRDVLKEARVEAIKSVSSSLRRDPCGTAWSIRRAVYKKILGANLNILNMKKAGGRTNNYEPVRKLDQNPHQRGGNRVKRSGRTDTIMHYGPYDRAWILRIVNSGTGERQAGTRGGRLHGNRGRIAPHRFFERAGGVALARAAEKLTVLIDTELEKMLNKKR